ncbi:hypothetical protein Rsub_09598 [Raphidocelis subcapitata]|uniref:Ketoreductase domain-containing protein n=1 Tax=Raphidocelis subcapitata TaxID=307507 RepID=A0A2V0PEP0_9CHLO|nr:hypothetical protein Rsub_09598 [Raphidocelis subcapitata]|eukprot:GBF97432.1 hypothetical protein Rsub_09598 [Raphidocelis subcapitata]
MSAIGGMQTAGGGPAAAAAAAGAAHGAPGGPPPAPAATAATTAMAASEALSARFGLAGRKALVTGGSRGIGRAIAEALCAAGARVYIVARRGPETGEAVEEMRARGFDVQGSAADLSDREECAALMEKVKAAFDGELHILVANAGVNAQAPTLSYGEGDYRRIVGLNQESTYVLCQLAHPLLAAGARGAGAGAGSSDSGAGGGGSSGSARSACIVFISSVAGGPLAGRSGSLYAMSKAAINQLAKSLACEWARDGIRVNSVAPWVTLTEMGKQNLTNPALLEGLLARTPMGRLAEPEDVAGVAAFLCSPAAAYVTGQTLAVDGGYSVAGYW